MEGNLVRITQRAILEDIILSDNIKEELNKKEKIVFSIIPELKNEKGFDHNHPHHLYDVWEHTKVAMEHSRADLQIRLALLLHDIGKPFSYQDEEVRHFHGHPEVSAKMSKEILERLEYGDILKDEICFLVRYHDTIIDKNNMDVRNKELINKLLEIQYCDAYAHHPDHIEKRIRKLNEIKKQIEEYYEIDNERE